MKLYQVAEDAGRCANLRDWYKIRTEEDILLAAWSRFLSTGIYLVMEENNYYATFSWDGIIVTILSAGRIKGEQEVNHAIEVAMRRCEEIKRVDPGTARWRTE